MGTWGSGRGAAYPGLRRIPESPFQGCPRLRAFSKAPRKMSSGSYWVLLEAPPFAPLAGGFCCSQSGTRAPDGGSAPCCRSRMLLLSWEWDGGEGPGGGSGCGCFSGREWDEGRGSPVGTVHTWPSPPLSPVSLSLHTVQTLSCPICCNLTWHTVCCTPCAAHPALCTDIHTHSYPHFAPPDPSPWLLLAPQCAWDQWGPPTQPPCITIIACG